MTAAVLKVEIEFPDPAAVATWGDASAFWDDTTAGWGGATVYTDVTEYVMSAQINRGRQHELGRVEAGTATIELYNPDRIFDPTNEASPYWPHVLPAKRIRIFATHASVRYPVFEGFVESWPPEWRGPSYSTVTITASDAMKRLALQDTSGSFWETRSGNRIYGLLNQAGWPTTRRNIDSGLLDVQDEQFDDKTILAAIQDAEQAEAGVFFISADGVAVFRDRHHRLPDVSVSNMTVAGKGNQAYTEVEPSFDDSQIANDVRVTPHGLEEQQAEDVASQDTYGRRVTTSTVTLTSEMEARDTAYMLLDRYAEPVLRYEQIRMKPTGLPALWPYVLGLDLGDRITIQQAPPEGTPVERQVHIESVTHRISPGKRWETDWSLSPAETRTFWILDDTEFSVLDDTTVLVF